MPLHENNTTEKDQSLWHRFRSGDQAAYTQLMHHYSRPLFRYGIRLVADRDFIKDCIQDIFFELWHRRENINPTDSVKSYLFKALRLRIFREQSKWNQAVSLEEDHLFAVEFTIETLLIEQQTTEEIRLRLEKALDNLPKRQKEALYLRFYENLDHDQIAQVMNLSRQSVYNLLHEAISRLRKYWFKEWLMLLLFSY